MMKFAPGFKATFIAQRIQSCSSLTPVLIALDFIAALEQFHAKKHLHLDLKGDNIIYDLVARKATIVDVGCALHMNKKREAIGTPRGTQVFMAPELRNILAAGKHDFKSDYLVGEKAAKVRLRVRYTEKMDIYSLGITLGQAFNLLVKDNEKKCWAIASPDSEQFKNNTFIQDEKVRLTIVTCLQKMTAEFPQDRPTLEKTKILFNSLKTKLEEMPENKLEVGVINVAEFTQLSEQDKEIIIKGLSAVSSEVVLISTEANIDRYAIQQVRGLLKDYALSSKPDIYHGEPDLTVLLSEMHKIENASHNRYIYISMQALTKNVSFKGKVGIATLTSADKKADIKAKVKKAVDSLISKKTARGSLNLFEGDQASPCRSNNTQPLVWSSPKKY